MIVTVLVFVMFAESVKVNVDPEVEIAVTVRAVPESLTEKRSAAGVVEERVSL